MRIPILFKHQFENEKMADRVLELSYSSITTTGRISAVLISFFEMVMFIRLMLDESNNASRAMEYGICYVTLLIASLFVAVFLSACSKNLKKYGKYIYGMEIAYVIVISAWATVITLLDGKYHSEFDVIVFMTIMLIVPLITYINPVWLALTQIVGDVIVLVAIVRLGHEGNIINFAVYVIISLLAAIAYNRNQKKMYIRQCQLQEKAFKDPLTGILNRQTLIETGEKVWKDCIKENKPVTVIMADIDFFKSVNDRYGHLTGDRIIISVAKSFEKACDRDDINCYRYGGEEFVMLIPGGDKAKAVAKTEEIAGYIKEKGESDPEGVKVTASFGVYSDIPTEDKPLKYFLTQADQLLYHSKENGRNRYTVNE